MCLQIPRAGCLHTRNELRLPDIAGYETLTGDFHIHTVFSDGKVWPDVRVNEAWRDGLDVIAVTDHLEYRPHGKKIEGDLNGALSYCRQARRTTGNPCDPGL